MDKANVPDEEFSIMLCVCGKSRAKVNVRQKDGSVKRYCNRCIKKLTRGGLVAKLRVPESAPNIWKAGMR